MENIKDLKIEVKRLEKEFEILGNKLEELAPFACPSGKERNEEKISECYATKKSYEDKRKEISYLYDMIRDLEVDQVKESKTFVNGYGEATTRNITSSAYEKQQKKLSKEIMSLMS